MSETGDQSRMDNMPRAINNYDEYVKDRLKRKRMESSRTLNLKSPMSGFSPSSPNKKLNAEF
jgi:hypothetical protein